MKAFEFKGRMMSMTVLKLLSGDLEELGSALAAQAQSAPEFLRNLPVIVDVDAIDPAGGFPLAEALTLLRERALLPFALRGRPDPWQALAAESALGFYPASQEERNQAPREKEQVPAASAQPMPKARAEPEPAIGPSGATGLLVNHTVRSGQQAYAPGGDLVVIGDVSPGAEVLAVGNIHVYGVLRGKALAGIRGDRGARIFCRTFAAELVSIAGVYAISEQFGPELAGQAVHVRMHRDADRLELKQL